MRDEQQRDDVLNIFLSHKAIDQWTAKKIAGALRSYGARSVNVKYSGERLHVGRDYREWIEDGLKRSEWYILAYTEPSKNWDWCLYEAGYFEALHRDDRYRLICIHPEGEVPEPLKRFDSVAINDVSLPDFCKKFLKRVNPELSSEDELENREALGTKIAEAFRDKIENRYYCRHVRLSVPEPAGLDPNDLPGDAKIYGTPELMGKLFGVGRQSSEWASLRSSPALKDRRWLVQLVHALKDIVHDRVPQPITGNIELPSVHENFLPVLSRVDELEDHSYECEILFADGITSRWAALRKPRVRALLTSIRMAVRFRYDIVDQFADRVLFVVNDIGPRRFREKFRNLMFDIVTEAEAHGFSTPDLLLECFEESEDRAEIAEMFREWEEEIHPRLFSALGMSPDPSVWTIFDDSPLHTSKEIEESLARLHEMNTRFLVLALQRFQDLLRTGNA